MSNNSKSLLKPSFYMGTTKAEPSGWFNTINEARCLNTMIKPISLYATMSTMGLVAIKYILSNSVIDQTDKVPFMDDTKVFGVFLNFIPGIIMASFYAKKKLWFNPHMDYMLLATPIIALGPLLWSLTRKSLIEASYQIILPTCLLPTFLNPLLYWNDELGLTALIRLCALQSLVYYLMVSYNLTVSVVFLSISRTTSGSVSVVDMVKSVCLFGIVFPILRYISSQLARRGLKLYSTKEPTNIEEERTLNYNTFRFIVCQDMVWSSLSNLLLAEIRDNTTFTIAVICSHIVIFASRIFSAATFRRLQLERKGKTTPILSETYHQVQKHVIMNVTDVQKTKPSLMRLTEDSPPDYKKEELTPNHRAISQNEDNDLVNVLVPDPPSIPLFTPISEETRFAFHNLASMFSEWCSRIAAFLITLLFTTTPPQSTWTQCRDPLSFQTHLIRGVVITVISLFMDACELMVEVKVTRADLKEVVEEFERMKVDWSVYFQMALLGFAACGAFVIVMPGILESGNECFKAGRRDWV